eukprot:TRINITY_DN12275_c1_g7_i5.p1 TRINITY_DN12275_c1_g7~~TRINITY_DN12275_c1_g7_i5.p1  ORF type:complete len:519 (+),score=174.73 TRINITY_DN12275_c1_g7_i5:1204-2760(+)
MKLQYLVFVAMATVLITKIGAQPAKRREARNNRYPFGVGTDGVPCLFWTDYCDCDDDEDMEHKINRKGCSACRCERRSGGRGDDHDDNDHDDHDDDDHDDHDDDDHDDHDDDDNDRDDSDSDRAPYGMGSNGRPCRHWLDYCDCDDDERVIHKVNNKGCNACRCERRSGGNGRGDDHDDDDRDDHDDDDHDDHDDDDHDDHDDDDNDRDDSDSDRAPYGMGSNGRPCRHWLDYCDCDDDERAIHKVNNKGCNACRCERRSGGNGRGDDHDDDDRDDHDDDDHDDHDDDDHDDHDDDDNDRDDSDSDRAPYGMGSNGRPCRHWLDYCDCDDDERAIHKVNNKGCNACRCERRSGGNGRGDDHDDDDRDDHDDDDHDDDDHDDDDHDDDDRDDRDSNPPYAVGPDGRGFNGERCLRFDQYCHCTSGERRAVIINSNNCLACQCEPAAPGTGSRRYLSQAEASSSSSDDASSGGAIVGAVVGGVALVALVVAAVTLRRNQQQRKAEALSEEASELEFDDRI